MSAKLNSDHCALRIFDVLPLSQFFLFLVIVYYRILVGYIYILFHVYLINLKSEYEKRKSKRVNNLPVQYIRDYVKCNMQLKTKKKPIVSYRLTIQ